MRFALFAFLLSFAAGGATLAGVWLSARFLRRVPGPLTGLVMGTLAYYTLISLAGPAAMGPVVGTIPFEWPGPDIFLQLFRAEGVEKIQIFLPELIIPGLVLGILGSARTLSSSVRTDTLTGGRHDSQRELIGQGVGNNDDPRGQIENPPSLVSRYSFIPSLAPSRPMPLSFMPPNGAAAEVGLMSLIPMIPNLSCSNALMAREVFWV